MKPDKLYRRIAAIRKSVGKDKHENDFPDLREGLPPALTKTGCVPGVAARRDKLTEPLWKKGAEEPTTALAAAREKASRIAPAYNKGALQYLGDADLRLPNKKT